jgi:hypothetical protein
MGHLAGADQTHSLEVVGGGSITAATIPLAADWREDWRTRPLETRNGPDLRGRRQYRYRDSNPGFRHERAAS